MLVRAFNDPPTRPINESIVRLWLFNHLLQLVVSEPLVHDYREILAAVLKLDAEMLDAWEHLFLGYSSSTLVALRKRETYCNNRHHNLLFATAAAGRVEFLITHDPDLLQLSHAPTSRLPFRIFKPATFLKDLGY